MRNLLFVVLFFMSSMAHADTLNFVLTAPTQSGLPGATISFDASVSAPSSNQEDVYLDALTVNAMNGLTADTDEFFNNFPIFLAPGDTFTGRLFLITLGTDLPSSFFLTGVVTLQGRIGNSDELDFAPVDFYVNSAVTPEPSTLSLMLIGLSACAVFRFCPSMKRCDAIDGN